MSKRNLRCMYAIALLQGMVFYGPIATLYREAQGVSIAQITLIESISLALCILLEVPWGILADKLGYKNTMAACCFLYFVSKLVFWQATGCSATSFLRNWDSILEKKRANLRSISEPARLRQPPPQKHGSGTRKRAGSKHTGGATNSRPSRAFCPLVG